MITYTSLVQALIVLLCVYGLLTAWQVNKGHKISADIVDVPLVVLFYPKQNYYRLPNVSNSKCMTRKEVIGLFSDHLDASELVVASKIKEWHVDLGHTSKYSTFTNSEGKSVALISLGDLDV